ncbi:13425_t:CDS:2, partial [Acaulospora morrowiae]
MPQDDEKKPKLYPYGKNAQPQKDRAPICRNSMSSAVRDVNWYRQLWWNTGNFHPKAKWNETT